MPANHRVIYCGNQNGLDQPVSLGCRDLADLGCDDAPLPTSNVGRLLAYSFSAILEALLRIPRSVVPAAVACVPYAEESRIWLRLHRNVVILDAVIGAVFAELLAAAQGGDEEAFTQLWLDANSALLRYLWVIAPEAAEDIAADTWVHVIRGLPRFRGNETAWRAWLFTTARRRMIDQARRRSRLAGVPIHELPASQLPAAADSADVALEYISTKAAIALLADLPPLQAEVILLRVVAGLDTEAVARLVRRSPGAVRVAAHRGLRRLAQILTEAGVTL